MVAEKGKMLLEIVAPSRQVVRSERVDEVIAPGSEGEFGVLPGHTPFLTTLKVGMLSYREGRPMASPRGGVGICRGRP